MPDRLDRKWRTDSGSASTSRSLFLVEAPDRSPSNGWIRRRRSHPRRSRLDGQRLDADLHPRAVAVGGRR